MFSLRFVRSKDSQQVQYLGRAKTGNTIWDNIVFCNYFIRVDELVPRVIRPTS